MALENAERSERHGPLTDRSHLCGRGFPTRRARLRAPERAPPVVDTAPCLGLHLVVDLSRQISLTSSLGRTSWPPKEGIDKAMNRERRHRGNLLSNHQRDRNGI